MHYLTRSPLPTLEDRIVDHLAKAPATRSQLCEALDTSRTNLGRALATLLRDGSVSSARTSATGRGRPTQLLILNATAVHSVGLNVTRTSCAGVMLSRSGAILAAVHLVSPASSSLLGCVEQTCEALAASAARQGGGHLGGARGWGRRPHSDGASRHGLARRLPDGRRTHSRDAPLVGPGSGG